jgi:hypothetical protein
MAALFGLVISIGILPFTQMHEVNPNRQTQDLTENKFLVGLFTSLDHDFDSLISIGILPKHQSQLVKPDGNPGQKRKLEIKHQRYCAAGTRTLEACVSAAVKHTAALPPDRS